METILHLSPKYFTETETTLLKSGVFSASIFSFLSGVAAVRLVNDLGEIILLPYQGQQVWDVTMRGRRMTMKSMFDQPYPTRDYLATFGGLLQHCGATAMGVPGAEDNHPLHGELPNAPYQQAHLVLGRDEGGEYIGLGGVYRHTIAFNYNYLAQPLVKLYAGSSVFTVGLTVTNLKRSPMPLMYLAHINLRPVDDGRLWYTVRCNPQNMRVRDSFPDFMEVNPEFRKYVKDLVNRPEEHLHLRPDLRFDPEIVFFMDYFADREGWAHALQVHPDGTADVVRHRPDQLGKAVRWICRTPDQEALGFEPATAEGTGYTSEKAKGNVRTLQGGESFHCDMEIGILTAEETARQRNLIESLGGTVI